MHILRYLFRFLIRALGLLILFLLIYACCYTLVPKFKNGAQDYSPEGDIHVYLLRSGVHTDIVMPWQNEVKQWSEVFKANQPGDTSMRYLAVGWGHRKFYMETPTWADLTVANACSAAVGIGETALHVRNIDEPVVGPDCRCIMLNSQQYKTLCEYIQCTTGQTSTSAQAIEKLRQPHDVYYEAVGRYHAFRTCNTWVSDALWAAQISGPWWTASTDGLFLAP